MQRIHRINVFVLNMPVEVSKGLPGGAGSARKQRHFIAVVFFSKYKFFVAEHEAQVIFNQLCGINDGIALPGDEYFRVERKSVVTECHDKFLHTVVLNWL